MSTENDSLIEIIKEVKLSSFIAVEILNDLLLYEKIEDGMFAPNFCLLTLSELMGDTEKLFLAQVSRKWISFFLFLV